MAIVVITVLALATVLVLNSRNTERDETIHEEPSNNELENPPAASIVQIAEPFIVSLPTPPSELEITLSSFECQTMDVLVREGFAGEYDYWIEKTDEYFGLIDESLENDTIDRPQRTSYFDSSDDKIYSTQVILADFHDYLRENHLRDYNLKLSDYTSRYDFCRWTMSYKNVGDDFYSGCGTFKWPIWRLDPKKDVRVENDEATLIFAGDWYIPQPGATCATVIDHFSVDETRYWSNELFMPANIEVTKIRVCLGCEPDQVIEIGL